MNKDEYILQSLSKIKHKKWEFFVISRILHNLNDHQIEFVCQQFVRRPDGRRAHTDLYFPQFGLHLEVNESHHAKKELEIADQARSRDIVDLTGHTICDINAHEKRDGVSPRSVDAVVAETDKLIVNIGGNASHDVGARTGHLRMI